MFRLKGVVGVPFPQHLLVRITTARSKAAEPRRGPLDLDKAARLPRSLVGGVTLPQDLLLTKANARSKRGRAAARSPCDWISMAR